MLSGSAAALAKLWHSLPVFQPVRQSLQGQGLNSILRFVTGSTIGHHAR